MFNVNLLRSKFICVLIISGLFSVAEHSYAADAETRTHQLQELLPDTSTLQGFSNIRPSAESSRSGDALSAANDRTQTTSPTTFTNDQVTLDANAAEWLQGWVKLPSQTGRFSQIVRSLFHDDGIHEITMTVNLCDSSESAENELSQFLKGCSTRFQQGSFNTQTVIGDDSWYNPSGYSALVFRSGHLVVEVEGSSTYSASRTGGYSAFPTAAVEAVAYQILLRASQQPELTGVSVQQAQVDVRGHALPKNALLVAGQTYVPVAEFAKAMGLTSRWNDKTGALTFSGAGHKTVMLTAGSTAATVGGVKAAALSVPVLKQNGEPVMTLTDLLAVTGGRIVGHSGNTVQVKG